MRKLLLAIAFHGAASTIAYAQQPASPSFTLDQGQAAQAAVVFLPEKKLALHLVLLPEQSKDFALFTRQNIGSRCNLMVAGILPLPLVIKEPISNGTIDIDIPAGDTPASVALVTAIAGKLVDKPIGASSSALLYPRFERFALPPL